MCSFAIVIPVYNEAKTIERNLQTLLEYLVSEGLAPSIIVVDDGSTDDTWERLLAFCNNHSSVSCLKFSRNFGKEAAIFAGIREVSEERCLIMDSDLQHPPQLIREFITQMNNSGANIVEGVKTRRGQEGLLYRLFAKSFYKLLTTLSGIELDNSSDFKLIDRKVIDAVNDFRESNVFFRGLVEWSGFTRVQVPFSVPQRVGDNSKFSVKKLMELAINSILSYTSKPLYFTMLVGLLFLLGAVILGINTLYHYFSGQAVSGFTTVILLDLISGSLVLLSLGIIGAYVSRIYNEVKRRPRYIICERTQESEE